MSCGDLERQINSLSRVIQYRCSPTYLPPPYRKGALSNHFCWSCPRKQLNISGHFHSCWVSHTGRKHMFFLQSIMGNVYLCSWASFLKTPLHLPPTKPQDPLSILPRRALSLQCGKNSNLSGPKTLVFLDDSLHPPGTIFFQLPHSRFCWFVFPSQCTFRSDGQFIGPLSYSISAALIYVWKIFLCLAYHGACCSGGGLEWQSCYTFRLSLTGYDCNHIIITYRIHSPHSLVPSWGGSLWDTLSFWWG